jgi:hypothetical protein
MILHYVEFQEDSTNVMLGRLTSDNGSGSATGVKGEGSWLEQADFSSITCKVFDRSSQTESTAIATPSVTIATSVIDTPVTDNALWTKDTTGYNFKHSLANTIFTTGGNTYRVEYKGTLTNGDVFHWGYEGPCKGIITT